MLNPNQRERYTHHRIRRGLKHLGHPFHIEDIMLDPDGRVVVLLGNDDLNLSQAPEVIARLTRILGTKVHTTMGPRTWTWQEKKLGTRQEQKEEFPHY